MAAEAVSTRRADSDYVRRYYEDPTVVAEYLHRRTGQPLNGFLHGRQVRFVRRVLKERKPARMLEIAPGPARLTAALGYQGALVAVERSAEMLRAARARLGGMCRPWLLVCGDAFALPVGAASVDLVLATRFLRRFRVDDRRRLYGEIRRVLRPAGALVLDAQNRAVALPHRMSRGLDRYPVYDELYALDELVAEIEAAGFRVVNIEGMVQHSVVQRRLNRLRHVGLSRGARWAMAAIEMVPGRAPSTWMAVCEVQP